MSDIRWTPQQEQAIWGKGGDLLLSAAAGSGKTAVLSERAVRLIADLENPIPADRLLIVTFTRAAATEMKDRIYRRLLEDVEKYPLHRQLQLQLSKLPYANISTIHSFCLDLVKQYFQRLGVSPTIRVADEGETRALEREMLEEIIGEKYAQKDKSRFLELVEQLSGGKNDLNLTDAVLKIYAFLRSLPFYEGWCENRLKLYDCTDVESSIWGQVMIHYCLQIIDFALRQAQEAVEYAQGDTILAHNYGTAIEDDLMMLKALKKILSSESVHESTPYEEAQQLLLGFKFTPLGRKKGADEQDKAYLATARDHIKDSINLLKDQLCVSTQQEFLQDVADLRGKMTELFDLALTLDRRLWAKKKELSALDFGDLEHLTLKLLLTPLEPYGKVEPTALAGEIAGRFDEIMVDECQDINEVQDLIFRTLSRKNLFMVGDVKQSIYSFRQARPELFVEKLKKAFSFDEEHFPAKLLLSHNFRSRGAVTDGINEIFARLMTERVGGIDYTHQEHLYPAASFPEHTDIGWEIHYLDQKELGEGIAYQEYEAYYIAKQIQRLVKSGYLITKGRVTRPIEYHDIAVLLRSPRGVMHHYRKAFGEAGIPIHEEIGRAFLMTSEVRVMVNLLKVIDNPLLDLELLGLLLSPIGGFTPEEVAEIRSQYPKGRLYSLLQKHRKIQPKAEALLQLLSTLRGLSAMMPASRLVMEIYEKTAYHLICRSMKGGESRYGNLMLLGEYFAQWEGRGCQGLSAILRFMDSISARDADLPAAEGDFGIQGVHVLSIHKSKGLEFPVVILGAAAKQFNRTDIHSAVVLDNTLGFTAMGRDRKLRRQYKTLPLLSARVKATENMISEELRVLYVALTRAQEKLLVVGSVKDPMTYIGKKETILLEDRVSPYEVLSQNSYLDLLTVALAGQPHFLSALNGGGTVDHLKVVLAPMQSITFDASPSVSMEEVETDQAYLKQVKENMAYDYAFPSATMAPTKLSVSELVGKEFEEGLFTAKPRFMLGDSISATESGTAVHAFMQLCHLERAAENCQGELERLSSLGIMTRRQQKAVNIQQIEGFFQSEIWQMLLESDRYLREYRFISYLKAERRGEYALAEDGEKTVLQGISDLILLKGKEAILVDFKTDRVAHPQRLVELYQGQMSVYQEMLSDTLGVSVKRAMLYSFHLGTVVEIPLTF